VMNICDWYLFQGVGNVIGFQRVIGPKLLGLPTDEAAIAQAMPKAHAVFRELSRLLGSNSYFAGDRLSLADLMIGAHLDFFTQMPEWVPLSAATPNLVAWLARMNERDSMKSTTWERVAQRAAGAAQAA
jgi:glutathione S-transferase